MRVSKPVRLVTLAVGFFVVSQSFAEIKDELTVTARKKDESLIDTPLALAVFGADEIDRMGAGSLEDLTMMSPGVQFQNQAVAIPGRYNSAVRFRGMATNLSQPSQQIGTVFLDGIWVSGSVFGLGFDDVERVEIIRGPQSAIFGRSTFGGAVNYITRTPGNEYAGRITGEIAEFGSYDMSISHEGPILEDELFYRVSIRGFGTDGQYNSATDGGDLGREETQSFAGTLFWQPNDDLNFKLRGYISEDDDGPPDGTMLGGPLSRRGNGPDIYNCFATGGLDPMTANRDFVCGEIPQPDLGQLIATNTNLDPGLASLLELTAPNAPSESDIPRQEGVGLERDTIRVSLQVNYTLENEWTITSNTGYNEIRADWIRDSDSTGFSNAWQRDPQVHEDFTQELRLASNPENRLSWLVGLNYFMSEYLTSGSGGAVAVDPNGDLDPPLAGPLGFSDPFAQEEGDALGIFGAVSYRLTDQVTLDLEGRFQSDEVKLITATETFKETYDTFLPRAIVRYQPSDTTTLYASFAQGNIPGLFNVGLSGRSQFELDQITAECGCGIAVDEETLDSIELGWKQELLDGRLFLSTAVYYMEWEDQKNLQNVAFIQDDMTPFAVNVIGSVGKTELTGIELEGQFDATDNLSGLFTINYAESDYKRFNCAVGLIVKGDQNCAGNQSPRYPEWSASLSATYSRQFGSGGAWTWYVRPDITYQDKQFNDETNLNYIADYTLVNLRGGFEKENLRLEVFVRNLFDDDSWRSGATRNDFSGQNLIANIQNQAIFLTPPDQQTFGVKAVVEF